MSEAKHHKEHIVTGGGNDCWICDNCYQNVKVKLKIHVVYYITTHPNIHVHVARAIEFYMFLPWKNFSSPRCEINYLLLLYYTVMAVSNSYD